MPSVRLRVFAATFGAVECAEDVKKGFDVISACDCPQTCTEASYTATVSTALWPSKVYSVSFVLLF